MAGLKENSFGAFTRTKNSTRILLVAFVTFSFLTFCLDY